jgi:chaperone required for assembly of F1-ATPase
MKRFWDRVGVAPGDAGWRVLLDDRAVHLPTGTLLLLPTLALAEAVAAEWRQAGGGNKGGETAFAELPLTRIAGTAQERIAADAESAALELARYAESDLLCYRAETPENLVRRQEAAWQPWLDWAAATHGARLRITSGVIHIAQPADAVAALAAAVSRRSALALAALGIAVPALGSLVLGLALADGALAADVASDLSVLDETFQEAQWGADAEAAARRQRLAADVALAGRVLALERSGTA